MTWATYSDYQLDDSDDGVWENELEGILDLLHPLTAGYEVSQESAQDRVQRYHSAAQVRALVLLATCVRDLVVATRHTICD